MEIIKLIIFVILSLFLMVGVEALKINEIMYNPDQCSDDYCEWVELYNEGNESINLSGWTLNGNDLEGIIEGQEYIILADELVDSDGGNESFEAFWGNNDGVWDGSDGDFKAYDFSLSLKNTGDGIILTNGSFIEEVVYDPNWGGDGNNLTLERTNDGWGEGLVEGGTPGRGNSIGGFSMNYSQIKINEFLVDPVGQDDAGKPGGEWIELYNPMEKKMNLGGLVLYDKEDSNELYVVDTKTLNGTVIEGKGYLVVYRDGDSDFALNNNGWDKVRLYDGYPPNESNLIDEVSYSGSTEGMSWGKVQGQWEKTIQTPSMENFGEGNCDWKIDINLTEEIINDGSEIDFKISPNKIYGKKVNLSVVGYIEDVFGKEVKNYRPWTDEEISSRRTKSYSPNLKQGVYLIWFNISSLNCEDDNEKDNLISKLVVVNPRYKINESTLAIEKLYLGNDDEAAWGEQFRVKVNIYKGDESKYSVQLYVNDETGKRVSKTTKVNIDDKYSNHTLTLPVQLTCGPRDGDYDLVLEGLGEEDRDIVRIVGSDDICSLEGRQNGLSGGFSYELMEYPSSIKGDFKIKVKIEGDNEEHEIRMWSYVYRGPKNYSGREANKEVFRLEEGEIRIVEQEIKVRGVEKGDYKLKVKINKDNQKTDKEITKDIRVIGGVEEIVVNRELLTGGDGEKEKIYVWSRLKKPGRVVYMSNNEFIKENIHILLVGALILLLVCVIWKRI